MTTMNSTAQDGKATSESKTFSRTTRISQTINAESSVVWELLTNAENHPKWNSTVVSIEGKIALGEKIKLVSTLDTSRTFKLKVRQFEPNKVMAWGDGMGDRVYTITEVENGVRLDMNEKIGGFMFPLFANKIPSFIESFEQFMADLKKEAESK